MGLMVNINGYDYSPKIFTFPGGEVNVNFKNGRKLPVQPSTYTIRAVLKNSEDVM